MSISITRRAARNVRLSILLVLLSFLPALLIGQRPVPLARTATVAAEVPTARSQHLFQKTWPKTLRRVAAERAAFSAWVDGVHRRDLAAIAALVEAKQEKPTPPKRSTHQLVPGSFQIAPVLIASSSIASVEACIKSHESGDYGNHSNGPDGASGAYQFIGSTWRHWSALAGHSGYSAAWLAPPAVQDSVTTYTLTHGGAHNWDPRYGNDPCTTGLP